MENFKIFKNFLGEIKEVGEMCFLNGPVYLFNIYFLAFDTVFTKFYIQSHNFICAT